MAKYVVVFVGLLLLTTLTLLLSFAHTHAWAVPIAMSIALAKAVLVVLWFMHLAEHRSTSRLALVVSFLLFVVFITFSMVDVGSRDRDGPLPPYPAAPVPADSIVR